MLGRIDSETVSSQIYAVLKELVEILLEACILGIHIRKAAHLIVSELQSVGVTTRCLTCCMVKSIASTCCLVQSISNLAVGRCCMVWQNINDDCDTILISHIAHVLELIPTSQLIVTDNPIGGLIMIPPHSVGAVKIHARIGGKTFIYRRSLNRSITCIRNIRHVLCNGVEAPAKSMKYSTVMYTVSCYETVVSLSLIPWCNGIGSLLCHSRSCRLDLIFLKKLHIIRILVCTEVLENCFFCLIF